MQPVVQPVVQPVASCIHSFTRPQRQANVKYERSVL